MSSFAGSINNFPGEDETSPKIHLRFDGKDSYFQNFEYEGIEEEGIASEEAKPLIQDGFEALDEEEAAIVIQDRVESTDILKPYIGLQFKSHEEAYNFYNNYALRVGFSVRKGSQGTSKNGVTSKRFLCSKEGICKYQANKKMPIGSLAIQKTPEKEKGLTRTGCKASCRVRMVEGGIWEVSVFVEDHNHALITSPSKKRNLRSHKCMTEEVIGKIRNLNAQNMGTSQIMGFLAIEHGGMENIRFKKKDVSNRIAADRRKLLGVDVDTTIMFFQKKQAKDPEFFYAIEPDDDGVVKNIFWVDGRARRAYQEFGDVVTFDTTYQTNKFSMPLAPFIGVSHHRHSIFFGMALLRLENAPNFVWLFKTWLVAMYDKNPKAIITDQDPAMRKSIKIVFPNTTHRCCQWHVMRKAGEHLGVLYDQLDGFHKQLCIVINRSLTVAAFEAGWKAMVNDFKLHENKHIHVMFESRSEWVPAYFLDNFFAEMSTTQRSESMNALFKLWVNNHTSIYQFVLQIEKMVEGIWQRESDEDLKTINEIPRLWSPYQIEVEAREVYTRNVFSVFKKIVKDSLLGSVTEIERDTSYKVDITFHPDYDNWMAESYMVKVDKDNSMVTCDCKGYEVDGLLCCHAIKAMQHVGMTHLPNHYILRRWTKNANENCKRSTHDRSMDAGGTVELQSLRFAIVKSKLLELGKIGSLSVAAFSCLEEIIGNTKDMLLSLVGNIETEGELDFNMSVAVRGENGDVATKKFFIDPPKSQCKGKRKKLSRFKSAVEKHAKKMRTCSICNAKEGHNARTCPQRHKKIKKGEKIAETDFSEEENEESDRESVEVSE